MLPTIGNATLCGDRRGRGAKTRGFLRCLICPRNPAEIGVQTQGFLRFFCGARATFCGDRRGRGAKTRFCLRFLRCPRNLLRGSAWSRCKNSKLFFAFFAVPARPSAEIGVVEVQKLGVFLRFLRCPRDPLRGSAWSRCKNSRFFCVFFCGARATPAEIVRVEALSLWRRAILLLAKWVCAPAFAIPRSRVRFPPGPRQLRLENRSF